MRLASILLLAFALALPAADVTGKWVVTIELDAGSGERTFTLKQQGEKITGVSAGQLGDAPVTGIVKGDNIELVFTIKSDAGEVKATFTGTVAGDTMKGKATYGELGSGTFSGKRAP